MSPSHFAATQCPITCWSPHCLLKLPSNDGLCCGVFSIYIRWTNSGCGFTFLQGVQVYDGGSNQNIPCLKRTYNCHHLLIPETLCYATSLNICLEINYMTNSTFILGCSVLIAPYIWERKVFKLMFSSLVSFWAPFVVLVVLIVLDI